MPAKRRGPYKKYLEPANEYLKPRTTIFSQAAKHTISDDSSNSDEETRGEEETESQQKENACSAGPPSSFGPEFLPADRFCEQSCSSNIENDVFSSTDNHSVDSCDEISLITGEYLAQDGSNIDMVLEDDSSDGETHSRYHEQLEPTRLYEEWSNKNLDSTPANSGSDDEGAVSSTETQPLFDIVHESDTLRDRRHLIDHEKMNPTLSSLELDGINLRSTPDNSGDENDNGMDIRDIPTLIESHEEINDSPNPPPERTENENSSIGERWEEKYAWNTVFPLTLKLSKYEIMLEIFHLAMRHGSMKGPLICDLLKFINTLFSQNILPVSEYIFSKLFTHHQEINFHFFCDNCMAYFGVLADTVSCRHCHEICEISGINRGSFFLSLSIKDQLEQIFRNTETEVIDHLNRQNDKLVDIMDGSLYRALCQPGELLSDSNALTVTFNTDGAPVFVSRAGSIWPIQLIVNEIAPHQRFKFENTVLCGLWFGKRDPNMSFFLNPFIQEMNSLAFTGIQRKLPDGTSVQCPVYALCCCVDSVAKPKLQNLKQFNGRYGCGYCMHPTNDVKNTIDDDDDDASEEQPVGMGKGKRRKKKTERRYLPDTYPYRSHESMKNDMFAAEELRDAGMLKPPNDSVNGLKGISALLLLLNFNVVFGFTIDYMHNVLAGVTERLIELICKQLSEEKLQSLNRVLKNLTPPQNILRRPRPLSERSDFKCKEWRAFLLFYCLPLLRNELAGNVYENLQSFVIAISILLKSCIKREELNVARELLDLFVSDFHAIYGDMNMVYNIHLLTHLVDIVEMWGPLWAYSAFSFESGNGELLKLVAGTTAVPTQICEKYCLIKSVSHSMSTRPVSKSVLSFCSSLMNYRYVKNVISIGSVTAFGISKEEPMTNEEQQALQVAGFTEYVDRGTALPYFNRVIMTHAEGNPFYSASYARPTAFNDTCVQLNDYTYAVTDKFVMIPDSTGQLDLWVLARPIQISEEEQLAPHIHICAHTLHSQPLKLLPTSSIRCKALLLSFAKETFVMDFPNLYEKY